MPPSRSRGREVAGVVGLLLREPIRPYGTGAAGCTDVDECATDNGGCSALVACTNSVGSFSCGDCPSDYLDDGAGSCTDIDECATDNGMCAQTCSNSAGSFACSCGSGFTLNGDAMTCDDIDECLVDRGGCDDLVTCTNTTGSRDCGLCPSGYSDDNGDGTSCTDVDECATDNGGCSVLTTCTNTAGGFTCGDCPSGYLDDGAGGCTDINECDTNNGGCDALASCTNTDGGRTCGDCPSGYSGTGETGCTNVDECMTNADDCEQLCTDTPGSFTCSCGTGYTLNGDGTSCDDINECLVNNGGCDPLTACTNNTGATNTCGACPSGYSGDGTAGCVDINECLVNNGGCAAMEPCTNNIGGPPTCGCSATQYGSSCQIDSTDYTRVYAWNPHLARGIDTLSQAQAVYTVDNSASAPPFTRVAYLLELNADYVWVEFDAPTTSVADFGIPHTTLFDTTAVTNLLIATNSPNLTEATGQMGLLEFWNNNYAVTANNGQGSSSTYDTDDLPNSPPSNVGYGSFQVHSNGQTVLAWNRWGVNDNNDLGIGQNTQNTGNPNTDWTFMVNSGSYTSTRLTVRRAHGRARRGHRHRHGGGRVHRAAPRWGVHLA